MLQFPRSVITTPPYRYGGLAILAVITTLILAGIFTPAMLPTDRSAFWAGGNTTVQNRSSVAFSQPAPGLTAQELEQHTSGDANFEAAFVTAPATVNPGLGPLFNNASCVACHLKDGRGMPHLGQALVRVSLPTGQANVKDGAVPVPGIGLQIRPRAIYGHRPDARVKLLWSEQQGHYRDGTVYNLRSPRLKINAADPQKPIPAGMLTSLRIPPAVFGSGLLEALPEADILAHADPDDRDGDKISGRPNYAWDLSQQKLALGRFGHKANSPNLLSQTAAAYHSDMGVTNPLLPSAQGGNDIDQQTLDDNTFYVQTLGVPGRTLLEDRSVQRGEKLFKSLQCAACHVSTLKTGPSDITALAHQTIHPYTDLLLHDLGPSLGDGRPDFLATGQEWRTPPLWGLGLVQTVLPYGGYLHDGRARSIAEAILWHGGEAASAQEQFAALPESQRADLLRFLNSL
jgi:CxxC motif-containing protein (DUF1111 family)